jgi:hypothetical protein
MTSVRACADYEGFLFPHNISLSIRNLLSNNKDCHEYHKSDGKKHQEKSDCPGKNIITQLREVQITYFSDLNLYILDLFQKF